MAFTATLLRPMELGSMTGKETYERWRKFPFWPRGVVECGFCIVVGLLVELLFSRQLVDLASAVLEGALAGFFLAVIDSAFFVGALDTKGAVRFRGYDPNRWTRAALACFSR